MTALPKSLQILIPVLMAAALQACGSDGSDSSTATMQDNQGPVFTSTPIRYWEEGRHYAYQPVIQAPDGTLSFTVSGPSGMEIDRATGAITWAVGLDANGSYPVTISADDGAHQTLQQFDLIVVRSEDNPAPPSPEPDPILLENGESLLGFESNRTVIPVSDDTDIQFYVNLAKQNVTSVDLYRSDITGALITRVASMTDDGVGVDTTQGDRIFTGSISVQTEEASVLYYRAVANVLGETDVVSRLLAIHSLTPPFLPSTSDLEVITPEDGTAPYVRNHIRILLSERADPATGRLIAQNLGAEVVGYGGLPVVYILKIPGDGENLDLLISSISEDKRVEVATKITEPRTSVRNDAVRLMQSSSWKTDYFEDIDAFAAWNLLGRYTNSQRLHPVSVGVIDSLIDQNNPELLHLNIIQQPAQLPVNYHGTQVAAVIAAESNFSASNGLVGGVTKENGGAMQVPLTLFSGNFFFPSIAAQQAIYSGAKILNLSYRLESSGGFDSPERVRQSKMTHARLFIANPDVLFVAAAGNDDQDVFPVSPAGLSIEAYQNLMVVAGSNPGGLSRWNNSNFGRNISLVAPAKDFWLPDRDSSDAFVHTAGSGTSFSAPLVASTISLLRSVDPTIDHKTLKVLLRESSELLHSDEDLNGPKPLTGHLLNTGNAMDCAIPEEGWTNFIAGAGVASDGNVLGSIGADGSQSKLIPLGSTFRMDVGASGEYLYFTIYDSIAEEWTIYRLELANGELTTFYRTSFGNINKIKVSDAGDVYFHEVHLITGQSQIKVITDDFSSGPMTVITAESGNVVYGLDVAYDNTLYWVEGRLVAPGGTRNKVMKRTPDGIEEQVADVGDLLAITDLELSPDSVPYLSAIVTDVSAPSQISHLIRIDESDSDNDPTTEWIPWVEVPSILNSRGVPTSRVFDFDIDALGNFYVAEAQSWTLYKATPGGQFTELYQEQSEGRSRDSHAMVAVDNGCRPVFITENQRILRSLH